MNEYNKAQIDYRDGCKARIKRQMEISKIISILPSTTTPLPLGYTTTPVLIAAARRWRHLEFSSAAATKRCPDDVHAVTMTTTPSLVVAAERVNYHVALM